MVGALGYCVVEALNVPVTGPLIQPVIPYSLAPGEPDNTSQLNPESHSSSLRLELLLRETAQLRGGPPYGSDRADARQVDRLGGGAWTAAMGSGIANQNGTVSVQFSIPPGAASSADEVVARGQKTGALAGAEITRRLKHRR